MKRWLATRDENVHASHARQLVNHVTPFAGVQFSVSRLLLPDVNIAVAALFIATVCQFQASRPDPMSPATDFLEARGYVGRMRAFGRCWSGRPGMSLAHWRVQQAERIQFAKKSGIPAQGGTTPVRTSPKCGEDGSRLGAEDEFLARGDIAEVDLLADPLEESRADEMQLFRLAGHWHG